MAAHSLELRKKIAHYSQFRIAEKQLRRERIGLVRTQREGKKAH